MWVAHCFRCLIEWFHVHHINASCTFMHWHPLIRLLFSSKFTFHLVMLSAELQLNMFNLDAFERTSGRHELASYLVNSKHCVAVLLFACLFSFLHCFTIPDCCHFGSSDPVAGNSETPPSSPCGEEEKGIVCFRLPSRSASLQVSFQFSFQFSFLRIALNL
jgi:hypothetical protein